ncbi:hypothetical protein AcV5_006627 [Taiwanofungus camphoratus]|nr:hypothetical protein AcV5_006627 [Antrodia cinnamomea]
MSTVAFFGPLASSPSAASPHCTALVLAPVPSFYRRSPIFPSWGLHFTYQVQSYSGSHALSLAHSLMHKVYVSTGTHARHVPPRSPISHPCAALTGFSRRSRQDRDFDSLARVLLLSHGK